MDCNVNNPRVKVDCSVSQSDLDYEFFVANLDLVLQIYKQVDILNKAKKD